MNLPHEHTSCPHSSDFRKEQCHLCELKNQIMILTNMYKELSIQVAAQHEFKLNQINANRIMDKKVDDVICRLKAWDEDFDYLDSLKLPKRIQALEEIIELFMKNNRKNEKKPHKCSVCDGEGIIWV